MKVLQKIVEEIVQIIIDDKKDLDYEECLSCLGDNQQLLMSSYVQSDVPASRLYLVEAARYCIRAIHCIDVDQ